MSLINQMLRDLDARHAPAVDRAALPSAVHVVPADRVVRPWLGVALVVVAAVLWYSLPGPSDAPPPPAAPLAAPAPTPIPPPAAAEPQRAVSAAPPPEVRLEPAPAPLAASNGAARTAAGAIAAKPKTAVAEAGRARANPSLSGPKEPPATAASTSAAAVTAATRELPPPSGATSIDKRARTSVANDSAENEYRKAMAALRRGATSEAIEGLHAALRADKQHVSARQALLSLLVEQQQWAEAQALSEEGLALDPAQTGWAMVLARLQLENGKLGEAAQTLAQHAAYAEQNADYQAFRALLLQKLKRSGEAAARYRAAVALKPAESRWWYGLGLSLEAEQKPQEAREAFLKARETGNLPPELAGAVEQRLR